MTKTSANSLKLDGDFDNVDVLYAIEAAFGIKISDSQAEGLVTVGDLYDLLKEKLGANREVRKVCFTAVSFYRLRKALFDISGKDGISPNTKLVDLLPRGRFGPFRGQIEQSTGLKLPEQEVMISEYLSVLIFFGSIGLAWFFFGSLGWLSLVFLLGWALIVPWYYFQDRRAQLLYADVGQLAKAVAGLNFLQLSRENDSNHVDDLWGAIIYTLSDKANTEMPVDRINKQTTFLE